MGLIIRAICDLSGARIEEPVGDESIEPADLIPTGWVRIDITRPLPSHDVLLTEQAKRGLIEGMIAGQRGAGAEQAALDAARPIIQKTADATFAAIESLTPPRQMQRVTILMADPDTDPQLRAVLDGLVKLLGIEPADLGAAPALETAREAS
jgi:hypothetical protein